MQAGVEDGDAQTPTGRSAGLTPRRMQSKWTARLATSRRAPEENEEIHRTDLLSLITARSEPRGAAPLAHPDWLRVDERGRRLAMAQVLSAPARRGGERERRPLRARTLPQVAAL
jgi:hypothetical protein